MTFPTHSDFHWYLENDRPWRLLEVGRVTEEEQKEFILLNIDQEQHLKYSGRINFPYRFIHLPVTSQVSIKSIFSVRVSLHTPPRVPIPVSPSIYSPPLLSFCVFLTMNYRFVSWRLTAGLAGAAAGWCTRPRHSGEDGDGAFANRGHGVFILGSRKVFIFGFLARLSFRRRDIFCRGGVRL